MSGEPEPRSVLIVGGTSGVGLATARRFAADLATRVTIAGRDPARGEAARAALDAECPAAGVALVTGDANRAEDAGRIVAETLQLRGRIDTLVVATVGAALPDLLADIPNGRIAEDLMQQALGPMLMARAVLPAMRARQSGTIITVASDAGKVATPGETIIGAAMAAIIMFSRTLAMEAKRDGIRVNCVTPSLIRGTATHDRIFAHPFAARLFEKAARMAALGVAETADLAALIHFLASPAAARITGQAISVNGGISAQ